MSSTNNSKRLAYRKSAYNREAQQAAKTVTIPAGTTLYRTADHICSYNKESLCSRKARCTNTRKLGVYFSTYILQSLGMCAEYNRDLQLGIFKTTQPITVTSGKYSHRFVHPERYYDENYKFRTVGSIQEDEMIGHFNSDVEPIITYLDDSGKEQYADMIDHVDTEGELFITEDEDLKKIELQQTYNVDKTRLLDLFMSLKWQLPSNSPIYLESDAVTPIYCAQKAAGRKNRRKTLKRRK